MEKPCINKVILSYLILSGHFASDPGLDRNKSVRAEIIPRSTVFYSPTAKSNLNSRGSKLSLCGSIYFLVGVSAGSRGGAREARPPLFWVKKKK